MKMGKKVQRSRKKKKNSQVDKEKNVCETISIEAQNLIIKKKS